MPDFFGVLADGTVGGELGSGSHVHQALAAEGHTVGIFAVGLQLGIDIGCVVQQQIVLVVAAHNQLVEQIAQAVVGGNSTVHQRVQRTAQVSIAVVDRTGVVAALDGIDLLDSVAEDILVLSA